MSKPVRFDHEAIDELEAAHDWYERQLPGLGDELLAEVDVCIARIELAPRSFGLAPLVARSLGVRKALLDRFPFSLVFVELDAELRVLAVAHQRRRPGYWRRRVRRPRSS